MSNIYVIGYADTRGEFEPKIATKSLKKAEQAKIKLKADLFPRARQWVAIKEVELI